ncbi:MAG: hypothetical protein AB7P34_03345 [Vicinamibacterales bacterium]
MPSPAVAGDRFFLSGGLPRGRQFYAVRPGASGDISLASGAESSAGIAWRCTRGSPYTPTPIVYGDYLLCLQRQRRADGVRRGECQADLRRRGWRDWDQEDDRHERERRGDRASGRDRSDKGGRKR